MFSQRSQHDLSSNPRTHVKTLVHIVTPALGRGADDEDRFSVASLVSASASARPRSGGGGVHSWG